ncbi:site-specific integrase [Salipiger sp. H15]|uniref:Site-specific integrase n=1 Tax=Alloyangia sp. H15 TaxID=3029062 RepID=A0AAU8AFH3_9RHOB
MTYQSTISSNQGATCGDVLSWAKGVGENRDAIYELEKVPARMGMADNDIGLIPADLPHFHHVIAKTPYGVVSNARDLEKARRRGNSRLGKLLERFHSAHGTVKPAGVATSFDPVIQAVQNREGFTDEGADFPTSRHKSLFALRARCQVTLDALDQAEIDRIFREATTEKRRALRRAINLLGDLQRGHNRWPDVMPFLPAAELSVPKTSDRAERILWDSLPETFRLDAEAVFREVLLTPADLAAWITEQMAAGIASADINRAVNERVKGRGRRPKNSMTAIAGYKGGVTWLVRQHKQHVGSFGSLPALRDLMGRELITAAIEDQIARSDASPNLKDAAKSQTLANRLTNLRTIARHGLHDPEIVAHIDVLKVAYHDYVVLPEQMTEEADQTCRMLQHRPDLAARFVNAPSTLARNAEAALAEAEAADDRDKEDVALRLYAAAALHAIQASRPLRTSNLIALRHRGSAEIGGNVTWIRKGEHAELRFLQGEIKNDQVVTVHLLGEDARILWTWMEVHRKRFLELRDLSDSPYVFPGAARPRFVKDAITLPKGCMAPATMAEVWALGDERIGLGISPHACRHAIATLILAVEPGNFAKAASVLSDTEETVRRHYGRDSGELAAKAVRTALLERHPDIFKRMKGRLK